MKSRTCCFLLWTVALLAVVSLARADVPQLLNYQGVLTSGGNPVVNPVDVVFSIWNDETAGDSLWSEQQTVDPDADGAFNVLLGSVSPMPDSVFAGTSAYLSIKIGADPDEITPRTRIVSSGYAHRVSTVDGASGGVISDELIVTDGGGDTTIVNPQRIVIRGAGGDVSTDVSALQVVISSAGAPVVEIGEDGIFIHGVSRAGDTTIKIGSDGIVQVSGGVMFYDSTIQFTQAGASNGLPQPGGTMTGPIASTGDPTIKMGKGNFGSGNTNAGDYSFVAGLNNAADGYASVVSGGQDNTAGHTYSTVGGGVQNAAIGPRGTIGGGVWDTTFARYGGVFSGLDNLAGDEETDTAAFVGGGIFNEALAEYSSILGGISNTASGVYSTVAGGGNNIASVDHSSVGGGSYNIASANGSSVGGGKNNRARGAFSVVAGGGSDTPADSNLALGVSSTVGGGTGNIAGASASTVGGGSYNIASEVTATVGGGAYNTASDTGSTVGGGVTNKASGFISTVAGGNNNEACGHMSVVGGGNSDTANGAWSGVFCGFSNLGGVEANDTAAVVFGGGDNTAEGQYSSILGGFGNTAYAYSIVGGGRGNIAGYSSAYGTPSFVGGGAFNEATGDTATICGGAYNTATGAKTAVCGGYNNDAEGSWSFIGSGYTNYTVGAASVITGGHSNTAGGNSSSIGGGNQNNAAGLGNTIGGGEQNVTTHNYSTISGGYRNTVDTAYVAIGGGQRHVAKGYGSVIAGGAYDTTRGTYAAVLGGTMNTAAGQCSMIGNGLLNYVAGEASCIPAGYYDTVTSSGNHSMAFGRQVYIDTEYRVALFDGSIPGNLGVNRDDRDGGINYPIHVGTGPSNGNAAYLTPGGVWTGTGKASRGDVRPLDGKDVLGRIENIPIDNWACKGTSERHIGPAAEDFHAQFEVGVLTKDGTRDTEYLAAADMAGVALVGVQELYRMVREQQHFANELQQKDSEIQALKMRLTQMESLVETILANQNSGSSDRLASNR